MPIGLRNLGNTCFLNSVLQALTYCDPLVHAICASDHSSYCKNTNGCVLCTIENHIKKIRYRTSVMTSSNEKNKKMAPHAPKDIIDILPMISKTLASGCQEDAHEFLRSLIGAMQLVLSKAFNKKKDQVKLKTMYPYALFHGEVISHVQCSKCKNISEKIDPVEDLELEISKATTLESALAEFCSNEKLCDANAYYCEKCKKKTVATRRLLLNRIPSVLSIQLKRFGYSNKAEPRKLNHFVEYPEVLQLHQYLNYGDEDVSQGSRKTRNSSVSRNTSNSASILNLFAVIVHYGANISNGHYVAYIKCNNEWHRTDDGHVSPCSSHEALDQNAYILFYTRSDTDVDYGEIYNKLRQESKIKSLSPISPDSNVRSKSSRRRFMYDTTGVDGVNSDIVQDYETAVGNTQGNKTRTSKRSTNSVVRDNDNSVKRSKVSSDSISSNASSSGFLENIFRPITRLFSSS